MLRLAIWGALGFWVANFAISLTPVAAEYRRALSIAYGPMLVEALLGGFVVGLAVSVALLRFGAVLPGRGAVGKSVVLSVAALVLATGLVELAAHSARSSSDPPRYFLIGLGINVVRFLVLGLVVGYLHRSRDRQTGG